MTSKESTFKEIICCQKKKISMLNRKLEEFDAVVSERNKLQEINKQFQQNNECIKKRHKKAFAELSATCNDQREKLKKAEDAEYQWELKYSRLEGTKNCICHQMNILKCNENTLQSQLAETETNLKCVQNELCTTKSELEEKNSMVNKLKKDLKCNENELCNVRSELEKKKTECENLNETNEILNSDLICIKKCLCDTKESAMRMEERFTHDREKLTNELKRSCEQINDLQIRYDEAMCKLNDERCKSKKLASKINELNNVGKNNLEMKNQIQKLQDEICANNNDLCCLKKKVCELHKDNDCKCMEINGLKNRLHEKECQLKKMCLLSEKIEQVKSYVEICCCPKKKCEPNPSCCPKNKCEPNPCCCPKNECETSPCCPKKKCKVIPCCPKKKCETSRCCPTKKCEIIPCCPKKKCETSLCCLKKKCETSPCCP